MFEYDQVAFLEFVKLENFRKVGAKILDHALFRPKLDFGVGLNQNLAISRLFYRFHRIWFTDFSPSVAFQVLKDDNVVNFMSLVYIWKLTNAKNDKTYKSDNNKNWKMTIKMTITKFKMTMTKPEKWQ